MAFALVVDFGYDLLMEGFNKIELDASVKMDQLPSQKNHAIEQLSQPPNSSSATHNSKTFIVLLIVILVLVLGTGAYLLVIRINQSQYVQQQGNSSPTTSESYPRPIFYNMDSIFKNAVGRRLFAEIKVKNPSPLIETDGVVYATLLDKKIQPIKFCDWCYYGGHLHAHDSNELHVNLDFTFSETLEKRKHSPETISYESYPKNMQEIIEVLGIHSPDQFSPDGKLFAFISYTYNMSVDLYPSIGVVPDRFYIQEISKGKRRTFNLPEGAKNWRIVGWSPDGTKIYLTKSYIEAFASSPDGLLIFDVQAGTVERIPKADKLLYPLRYDSKRQIFYGLESVVDKDGVNLKPPATIWKIEVPSGVTKRLFTSSSDPIRIDQITNGGVLIYVTLVTQYPNSYPDTTKNVWIIEPAAPTPEQIPVALAKELVFSCWGMDLDKCGVGKLFVVSNDNRFIAWVVDSKIWVYDRHIKKQWVAIDINELGENASYKMELRQFVIF